MKNYSNTNITKEQVEEIVLASSSVTQNLTAEQISAVDKKQSEQIQKLRVLLAISTALNFLIAVGAYFA